jgi:hypothetical protein
MDLWAYGEATGRTRGGYPLTQPSAAPVNSGARLEPGVPDLIGRGVDGHTILRARRAGVACTLRIAAAASH